MIHVIHLYTTFILLILIILQILNNNPLDDIQTNKDLVIKSKATGELLMVMQIVSMEFPCEDPTPQIQVHSGRMH